MKRPKECTNLFHCRLIKSTCYQQPGLKHSQAACRMDLMFLEQSQIKKILTIRSQASLLHRRSLWKTMFNKFALTSLRFLESLQLWAIHHLMDLDTNKLSTVQNVSGLSAIWCPVLPITVTNSHINPHCWVTILRRINLWNAVLKRIWIFLMLWMQHWIKAQII